SPADPPRELVVQGLYRYVRNPMYVGVITILIGELLITRTGSMLAFLGAWIVVVNFFIIGYEEPTLRRMFGDSYERYARRVGRWIPSFPEKGP
ncbi:MAG TPA: isoprenylcysteine carboxylmethyltransferase family protein, partial [Gemmatimonadales bacterium]|nr:isoprenylcysteine carboxylmethyltransferase family protein [Gemmatimonadales bacterium]